MAFLGGNGHGAARLERVRDGLAARGVSLCDVRYPGFEGGPPRAASFEAFLGETGAALVGLAPDVVVATGIGGLVMLTLRARGVLVDVPLVLQAPVLWGLETRWMPRAMRRLPWLRRALPRVFKSAMFQRRFARKHFVKPLDDGLRARFFAAYEACPALPDLFDWLDPALLARLEAAVRERPERFGRIVVWWGDKDQVVPYADWTLTAERLGVAWPVWRVPAWGHYPMIDDPDGWAAALVKELSRS